jgi:hypothetical protein
VPSNLTASSLPGELLVNWTPNKEKDLAEYEIGFGLVNDVNQFVYTRNMGAKEAGTGQLDAKLWGLKDNQTVYFGNRAYDYDGHKSNWSPLVAAKPWALSTNAWTPTPDSTALGSTRIEVAFDTPLLAGSIADADLRPGRGQDRRPEFQTFPAAEGWDDLHRTLKGGASGIATEDNRKMPSDYTWKFTAVNSKIYLPITRR